MCVSVQDMASECVNIGLLTEGYKHNHVFYVKQKGEKCVFVSKKKKMYVKKRFSNNSVHTSAGMKYFSTFKPKFLKCNFSAMQGFCINEITSKWQNVHSNQQASF